MGLRSPSVHVAMIEVILRSINLDTIYSGASFQLRNFKTIHPFLIFTSCSPHIHLAEMSNVKIIAQIVHKMAHYFPECHYILHTLTLIVWPKALEKIKIFSLANKGPFEGGDFLDLFQ